MNDLKKNPQLRDIYTRVATLPYLVTCYCIPVPGIYIVPTFTFIWKFQNLARNLEFFGKTPISEISEIVRNETTSLFHNFM